jgi:antitoxin component YwqK of YwqJK toxin-antitoxin module
MSALSTTPSPMPSSSFGRAAIRRFAFALPLALALAGSAHAINVCELNGASVNPDNGYTTAGKTGLMRCRDGEGGPIVREQELRDGKFTGIVRYFKGGVLQREYSVNERGNREGLSREYSATAGTNVLLREERTRNSTTYGLVRTWYPTGKLKRVSFYTDEGREQAVAEFTSTGQMSELRCGPTPQLAPDADDAAWCGFSGSKPSTVTLYGENGKARGRTTWERGERRKVEDFWEDGTLRNQQEMSAAGGVERSFDAKNVKRRETQWVVVKTSSDRPMRGVTLEQSFHESGTLVSEKRWKPEDNSRDPALEQRWYLNGQPQFKAELVKNGNDTLRRETRFHDNGKPSSEGMWLVGNRGGSQPQGMHKVFDMAGQLRGETYYDAKGRVTRERELDESGRVVRDDEVFEDGSRKAFTAGTRQ